MYNIITTQRLSARKKNIIERATNLFAGILCSVITIISLTVMDKNQIMTWLIAGFFEISSVILLWKFLNPKKN